MPEDRSHEARNDAERERLRALVARLSDDELGRAMPDGWTVATVLAHAAFWDARAISLLDKWAGGIAPSTDDDEPADITWINDAARALSLALPPRAAAQLALRLADEADARVAALTDAQLATIRAAGCPFNLSRGEHRGEHLDEIERVVNG
jgi:hypothetical protein